MNQVLHIFRKDTRQHWVEIVFSLVLTTVFFCVYPMQWRPDESYGPWQSVSSLLVLLMPFAWGILTVRVTQAENLVGDRQFWITRPYEWKELIAAKVLFLAAWIGLPYLIATSLLLHYAGFSALQAAGALTANAALVFGTMVLTVFAVAAVTRTFARTTLTALALLFAFILLEILAILVLRHVYTASVPYSEGPYLYPMLFAGCAAALLLIYATRRVWLTRGVLVAVVLVMIAVAYVFNSQAMVDRAYPEVSLPLVVTHDPLNTCSTSSSADPDFEGKRIFVSVKYSGVPENSLTVVEDYKFTVTAADGSAWSSPWQSTQANVLPQAGPPAREAGDCLSLWLKPSQYDHFSSGPVTLHVFFGGSRYQVASVASGSYPYRDGPVPGVGFCSEPREFQNALRCRAGARDLPLTRISAATTDLNCSDPQAPGCSVEGGSIAWLQTDSFGPTMAGVRMKNAFATSFVADTETVGTNTVHHRWHVQPGAPLSVTQYRFVDRGRADLVIPSFQLSAHLAKPDME